MANAVLTSSASEVQLIPQAELATGQAAGIRNTAIAAVLREAASRTNKPVSSFVVRDIQPKTDLGFTYDTWFENAGESTGYQTLASGTMATQRFVGLYGIIDWSEEMNIPLVRIKSGHSWKTVWDLERLYNAFGAQTPRIGFCPTVIVLPHNVPYTIERYVYTAYAAAQIVFVGFTVEPRGKTMSP